MKSRTRWQTAKQT